MQTAMLMANFAFLRKYACLPGGQLGRAGAELTEQGWWGWALKQRFQLTEEGTEHLCTKLSYRTWHVGTANSTSWFGGESTC